jgi:hypothetical protein
MDRPILMGKSLRIPATFRTINGAIMKEGTRNQLEVKLKEMLNLLDQKKAKEKQPRTRSGTGNIIRRRAGEKEKRFSA